MTVLEFRQPTPLRRVYVPPPCDTELVSPCVASAHAFSNVAPSCEENRGITPFMAFWLGWFSGCAAAFVTALELGVI